MTRKNKILKKLDSIDKKLSKIQKEEKDIDKKETTLNKKLSKLSKDEEHIEKTIVKIGNINVKRKHVYELIRACAGAFLGVGLGRGLLGLDSVARTLAWPNVIGILVFILGLSTLLIYKDQKENIADKGNKLIWQRLIFIYLISILIEFISLVLFNVQYDSATTLIKIMIVGSYTAMASAVTFSLAK